MSTPSFWRMTKSRIVEGVFALHKPPGITSAQALRDLQKHFDASELFEPWLSMERNNRARENSNQRHRRKMKKIQVKIGHGGTLDPMATGVLIAGVGKGTKVLSTFLECTKTYETVVLFGAASDTYDRTGKILKRGPYEHLTKEMAEDAIKNFRGKIMQRPPIYSALKMNGKPLYEYAREGKEIPREIVKRPVEVVELELLEWMPGGTHNHQLPTEEAGDAEKKIGDVFQTNSMEEITGKVQPKPESVEGKKRKVDETEDDLKSEMPKLKKTIDADGPVMSSGLQTTPQASPSAGPPAAKFRMTVTSGFYVRSFAFDLGQAMGSQAVMAELVRTRQGKFELGKNVIEYDDFDKGEDVWSPQVAAMLKDWSETYNHFSDTSKNQALGDNNNDESTLPKIKTKAATSDEVTVGEAQNGNADVNKEQALGSSGEDYSAVARSKAEASGIDKEILEQQQRSVDTVTTEINDAMNMEIVSDQPESKLNINS